MRRSERGQSCEFPAISAHREIKFVEPKRAKKLFAPEPLRPPYFVSHRQHWSANREQIERQSDRHRRPPSQPHRRTPPLEPRRRTLFHAGVRTRRDAPNPVEVAELDLRVGNRLGVDPYGTWIPTLSVTQMTVGIGAWMGLSSRRPVRIRRTEHAKKIGCQ